MTKPVIVTRAGKGSALTWTEGDTNLTNLRDATISVTDGTNTAVLNLNDTLTVAAGTNISLSVNPSTDTLTINSTASGGSGTVTSVGGTGTVNGITLTGSVTSSGNLTLGGTLSGVNLTSQVTGTLPVANGGTGATTTRMLNAIANDFSYTQYTSGAVTLTSSSTHWNDCGGTVTQLTLPPATTLITGYEYIIVNSKLSATLPVKDATGTTILTMIPNGPPLTLTVVDNTTSAGGWSAEYRTDAFGTFPTAGSYTTANITIDSMGRVTAASNGTVSLVSPGPIGSTTPNSGAFTTLSASSTVSGTGFSTYLASPPAIGGTTASTGRFTTITSTVATGTAPFFVASTTNVANLNASSLNGATFASPGTIGGTTPGAITGTTITANTAFSGPHNGTVGATTPNTGAFTTLSASSTVSGTGFSTYLASPPAIGGTTPAAGAFTTLSATTTGTTGAISVTYNPATAAGAAINATGKDSQGGVGYFDFLKITNTTTGATNANKTFRTNSTGQIEVINSAYGGVILALTDAGNLQAQTLTVSKDIRETVFALTYAATITPDCANGTIQKVTLTGNVTFSAFSNPIAGQSMTLIVTQDATGGRTLTSTMKFSGGSKTLSTAANAIDIISVFYDGSTYWASLGKGFA